MGYMWCAVLVLAASLTAVAAVNDEKPGQVSGESIRVMTYNIHHARGMDDRVDIERIAKVIAREAPDIVALQEVDRGVRRSGGADITAELAERTGLVHHAFAGNIEIEGGEYGNAFLTRYPIVEKKNLRYKHLHNGEQRGLLQLVVDIGGQQVLLLNTHLAHRSEDAKDRLFSVEQMFETMEQRPDFPVILLGDLNERPERDVYRRLEERFIDAWAAAGDGDGFTFSSAKPRQRIDYIWVRRESGLNVRSAKVADTLASDHLPLVVDLEMTK